MQHNVLTRRLLLRGYTAIEDICLLQLHFDYIENTTMMSPKMRLYVLMMIIVSIQTFSALQLSFFSVKPTQGKSNSITKSQVAFAQVAVSLALMLGSPLASSGNILISDRPVCYRRGFRYVLTFYADALKQSNTFRRT